MRWLKNLKALLRRYKGVHLMKLTLGTTVFGRPRIESLTAAYYATLASNAHVDVELVAAVSEPEAAATFTAAGWRVVNAPNQPLGHKHNVMLSGVRQTKPDAFILVGSDDWLIASVENPLDAWAARADKPLFGVTDLYVVDLVEQRACLWSNPPAPIGAGRMIRYDLLEAAHWNLWPGHINRGLDAAMGRRLGRHRWTVRGLAAGFGAVDFKTGVNIWGYETFASRAPATTLDKALAWVPRIHREQLEKEWTP